MALEDLSQNSGEITNLIETLETMRDEIDESVTEHEKLTEQKEAFEGLETQIDEVDTFLINHEANEMPDGLHELLTNLVKDYNTALAEG